MSKSLPTMICFMAMFGVIIAPEKARAKDEVSLAPVTPWNLDATQAGCALKRAFGDRVRPFMLELRWFEPGNDFQFIASGDEMDGAVRWQALEIQYGDLPSSAETAFLLGTFERQGQKPVKGVFVSSALKSKKDKSEATSPEEEAAVTQISLGWLGKARFRIETGSLAKPIAAVRQCTRALVTSWGLDPQVQATLNRSAQPQSTETMLTAIKAIYPAESLLRSKQARINFLALIDDHGGVTSCRTVQSYNDPVFDDIACKVMKKTRFDPALDRNGNPVASYFVRTVIYAAGSSFKP